MADTSESGALSMPPHSWPLAGHMLGKGAALLPVAGATLVVGMLLYHGIEGLPWADSFLNTAMLMGGMGPVDPIKTTAGKWLIGGYALFAGIFFILLAGVMLAPVVHHVLVRFHLERDRAHSRSPAR